MRSVYAAIALLLPVCMGSVGVADARAGERILYSFSDDGSDGEYPLGTLALDAKGNMYGTTQFGGPGHLGTVFKLNARGKESVLYSFPGGNDGEYLDSGVVIDAAGNIYGTTPQGGSGGCECGIVFKLTPEGTETIIHSFIAGTDGAYPKGTLTLDAGGNLYGTTIDGGGGTCDFGCGTVFKVSPTGKTSVFYAFQGADGAKPTSGVVIDGAGNLYGTTAEGGSGACGRYGCGTVFKLLADGSETVLYSFKHSKTDGHCGVSCGSLILDGSGNLYGTTEKGGTGKSGTVFKIATDGTETVLHSFQPNGADGIRPSGELAMDAEGNLYGTTVLGPGTQCGGGGCGTVFRIAPDNTESVIHTFGDTKTDGSIPESGVIFDRTGNLVGAAAFGGAHKTGAIFRVKP